MCILFVISFFTCSWSMVTYDWIGYISTCETWILLRWSFDNDALQWRNDFNGGHFVNDTACVSHPVDLWSMLFCTNFIEIIPDHRIGPACMAMVQRVPVWHDLTFVCCRRYQGRSRFTFAFELEFWSSNTDVGILSFIGVVWWTAATFLGYLSSRCLSILYRRVNKCIHLL